MERDFIHDWPLFVTLRPHGDLRGMWRLRGPEGCAFPVFTDRDLAERFLDGLRAAGHAASVQEFEIVEIENPLMMVGLLGVAANAGFAVVMFDPVVERKQKSGNGILAVIEAIIDGINSRGLMTALVDV